MQNVISKSTYFAIFVYFTVGTFGYLTFASNPKELTDGMQAAIIIIADYGNRFEVTLVIFIFSNKDLIVIGNFADCRPAFFYQAH